MSKNIFFCITIVCFAISNCFALSEELPYEESTLLIKFIPKADGKQKTKDERNQILSSFNAGTVKRSYTLVPGWSLVKLPEGMKVEDALPKLKGKDGIIYVEPNWKIELCATTPNDQYFPVLWGLHNTGQTVDGDVGTPDADIDAPEAWDIIHDAGNIIVALLDTGIDYTHPDLRNNMWTNSQGYHGYDFADGDNDPNDSEDGHGTACAGIIAGRGYNGIGVTGVAWNVKIMALKIFPNSTAKGIVADAMSAIEYAVSNGAKVLSNSWACYGSELDANDIQALKEHIEAANANGVLFIAGAHNYGDNIDTIPVYPASYDCDNIISVMATDQKDKRSVWGPGSSSNYGAESVDLAAPGTNILTCSWPGWGYAYWDGTSMSVPYVAGACALLMAYDANLTHLQVKDRILGCADRPNNPDPQYTLIDRCVTEGRLNLNNTIRNIPAPKKVHNISTNPQKHYYKIKQAVADANDNDVIVVDKGTYYENVEIDSVKLTIESNEPAATSANTIIDGRTNTAITIRDSEDVTLNGLKIRSNSKAVEISSSTNVTISNCEISSSNNLCIYTSVATVIIADCVISGNRLYAGISPTGYSNITVHSCQIKNCKYGIHSGYGVSLKAYNNRIFGSTGSNAYGIYLDSPANTLSPQIYDNMIYKNSTGIKIANQYGAYLAVRNNTVVNNTGYGILLSDYCDRTTISNCILYYNNSGQISYSGNAPTVTYSCVQGGFMGQGNIPSDPSFVAKDSNDFHLKFNSLCIDANTTTWTPPSGETDIDGEYRKLDGNRDGDPNVDMGADEYFDNGDFNYDGTVNFKDYSKLAKVWGTNQNGTIYDLKPSNSIDYWDLDILVDNWLDARSGFMVASEEQQLQMEGFGGGFEMDSEGGGEQLLDEEILGVMKLSINGNIDPNDPFVLEPNETASIGIWGDGNTPAGMFFLGFASQASGSTDISDAELYYAGNDIFIDILDDIDVAEILEVNNPFVVVSLNDIPIEGNPLSLNDQLLDYITVSGTGTLLLFDGNGYQLDSVAITSGEP